MESRFARLGRISVGLLGSLVCAIGLSSPAYAQGPVIDTTVAPPPLQFIPEHDRAQLAAQERDMRRRTRRSIELADERLRQAESQAQAQNFSRATAELGIYRALIADAFRFIRATGRIDNRARDLYRRLEQALRGYSNRIEAIRRTTPVQHAVHIREVLDYTLDTRTDALNSFFGDTVLRPQSNMRPPADEGQRQTESLSRAPEQR